MAPVERVFEPAPAGPHVRLVAAIFPLIMALQSCFVPRSSGAGCWIAILAPVAGMPIAASGWLGSAILRYRISGDELPVGQTRRTARFPLAGLRQARPENNVLSGARKN